MENEKSTGNKYTVKDAAIIDIFCAVMYGLMRGNLNQ